MNEKGIVPEQNPSITVCIHCLTYNHEPYLEDALKGFIKQKTDFRFVAVVIDDCSTDATAEVLRRYETQYPDIIKAVYLKENYYSQSKSKQTFFEPYDKQSKYIAICEGDDYWTDPLKLQKEVAILEKDETLMGVFTNSMIVDKQGNILEDRRTKFYPGNKQGRYNLHEFFQNAPSYPTATVMYRNVNRQEILQKMKHTQNKYMGDWTLWAILHSYGDFYYLDEVTSAYRINPTSLTHTFDRIGRAKANITICKSLSEVLPAEYTHYLKKEGWMYFSIFMAYRKERKYMRMVCYFLWCLMRYPRFTIKKLSSHGISRWRQVSVRGKEVL